jgi:hypothetical protein
VHPIAADVGDDTESDSASHEGTMRDANAAAAGADDDDGAAAVSSDSSASSSRSALVCHPSHRHRRSVAEAVLAHDYYDAPNDRPTWLVLVKWRLKPVAECSWEPVDSHFLWPTTAAPSHKKKQPQQQQQQQGEGGGQTTPPPLPRPAPYRPSPLATYLASLQDTHIRECIRRNTRPSRPERTK